ncbi:MAG TPA: adenylate/guanylate cyclase domain-containing protein [Acidimicrobiales bacterium]|nr:adenylate/guanylate cyclase domain-containing protein [Acidimicrobiales bacterium]
MQSPASRLVEPTERLAGQHTEVDEGLVPFVPRLLLRWQAETPEERFRLVEGTLVFIDLSGFTKMSERLAKHGRVGAEEVSDAVDATFSDLLGVAHDLGGQLLKFGGDALLLLFTDADHAARGCRAAHQMRARLRVIGRITTSAGVIPLRMSAGVHTGAFHCFLAGESHRELIITGVGATRVAEMETAANAGQIAISADTAVALRNPNCVGDRQGEGYLLRAAPSATWDTSDDSAPPKGADPAMFIPAAIREHLAAGGHESEHRQVTVAFIQFSGTDEPLTGGRTDEVADHLDTLIRGIQGAVAAEAMTFLGTDIYPGGGKIILTAGAPRASGNDQEKMLRVARAITDRFPGELRIAVNHGWVFAGEVGSRFRRTYTVMGDAVNLAARLLVPARPGQVTTTPEVLERSHTLFHVTRLDPFTPKGKAQPVVPWSVDGVRGVRVRNVRTFPLVGREDEMELLLTALIAAADGVGRMVQVVGDAGVGKSRLLEELRARAGLAIALTTVCEQYEASTPFFAFRVLLRALTGVPLEEDALPAGVQLRRRVDELAPELLPWLPLLAIVIDAEVAATPEVDDLDPAFRRAKIRSVVVDFVRAALPKHALLIFEDAHWMDEASSDVLNHLLAEVGSRPWLVCVARRYRDRGFIAAPNPALEPLDLEPLAPSAMTELVKAVTDDRPLPLHEAAQVARRAGGNPLFLLEMLEAGSGGETVPDSVESVIASRIDRLKPEDRTFLRHASVLGPSFDIDLLAAVAGPVSEGHDWASLAPFIDRESPTSFRFRQDLYREVAYEGLPHRLRRRLHAEAGESLESRADREHVAELLSLHYSRAGVYDKALSYSERAAERAKQKYANTDAAQFYRRAIEAGRYLELGPAAVARLWEDLGMVTEMAGLNGDASKAFNVARRLLQDDKESEARLLFKQGQMELRTDPARALRTFGRGLRALEGAAATDEVKRLRVRLLLSVADVRRRRGQTKVAMALADDAIRLAEAAGDRPGLAHAHSLMHNVTSQLGVPERARYRDLPLEVYEEIGDLRGLGSVLNNLGLEAVRDGRWDDARALYERAGEVYGRSGDVIGKGLTANNTGEILCNQGWLDEAEGLFREALRCWRPTGYKLAVAEATMQLGRLAARARRRDDAARLLDEARTSFVELKAASKVAEVDSAIAENHTDDPDQTIDYIASVRPGIKGVGGTEPLLAMLDVIEAKARAARGDREGAAGCLEAALTTARSAGADFELGMALEAKGSITGDAEAADEGAAILDRLGVVRSPLAEPLSVA